MGIVGTSHCKIPKCNEPFLEIPHSFRTGDVGARYMTMLTRRWASEYINLPVWSLGLKLHENSATSLRLPRIGDFQSPQNGTGSGSNYISYMGSGKFLIT